MTKRGSADVAYMLLNGLSILGDLTEVEETLEALLEPSHTLGDTWEEHSWVGVRRAEIRMSGFFNNDVETLGKAFYDGLSIAQNMVYGFAGSSANAPFTGWASGIESDYRIEAARDSLHKAVANFRTNGPVDRGIAVHPFGVETSSGQSTGNPHDAGASSTGWAAYYQAVTATDMATITLRVLHSSDNITYGTLNSTTVTWPFAGRNPSTAVVERYTAAGWSFNSASGGRTASFFIGVVRNITSAPA